MADPSTDNGDGAGLLQQADWLRAGAGQGFEADSLLAPLSALIDRTAVTCAPSVSLQEALALMHRHKVGSIVISEAGRPLGIYTERDLVRQASAGSLDVSAPISEVMGADPATLPAHASVSDAATLMAERGIRHVIVMDRGTLAGVVSESRLFAFHRGSLKHVGRAIELAQDLQALRDAAAAIRRLARSMVGQGMAAEPLTRMVSSLNDRLTVRIVQRQAAHHRAAAPNVETSWCWIALGSEGRQEQTISTDQDNGLIFQSAGPAGEARAWLTGMARDINDDLNACGFPLCRGGIMAGNPEWCLSAGEWRERFAAWIRDPLPQAVLNAAIFFDFRPLAGDAALARSLRDWLTQDLRGNDRFLRALAEAALSSRPPLGFLGDIVLGGETGHTIDLKVQGTRFFVDAARVMALAQGITETSTASRLRLAGAPMRMPEAEVEAMVMAFHFLLVLRLRRQLREGAGAAANEIAPGSLNEIEQRLLKASLQQARHLQQRLALDYRL